MFDVEFISNNNEFDLKESKINKTLLLKKFKSFINRANIQTSMDSIESIDIKDLIKILAMSCPFTTSEKQLLLESKNSNVLANKLIALFDLYNNQYNYKKTLN